MLKKSIDIQTMPITFFLQDKKKSWLRVRHAKATNAAQLTNRFKQRCLGIQHTHLFVICVNVLPGTGTHG